MSATYHVRFDYGNGQLMPMIAQSTCVNVLLRPVDESTDVLEQIRLALHEHKWIPAPATMVIFDAGLMSNGVIERETTKKRVRIFSINVMMLTVAHSYDIVHDVIGSLMNDQKFNLVITVDDDTLTDMIMSKDKVNADHLGNGNERFMHFK